jgi:hypothetical protein
MLLAYGYHLGDAAREGGERYRAVNDRMGNYTACLYYKFGEDASRYASKLEALELTSSSTFLAFLKMDMDYGRRLIRAKSHSFLMHHC